MTYTVVIYVTHYIIIITNYGHCMIIQPVKKTNIKLQTATKSSPSSDMESVFFDIHCKRKTIRLVIFSGVGTM